ncbi:hypothetical protein ACFQAT_08290 [Undibacterium arcticum]
MRTDATAIMAPTMDGAHGAPYNLFISRTGFAASQLAVAYQMCKA